MTIATALVAIGLVRFDSCEEDVFAAQDVPLTAPLPVATHPIDFGYHHVNGRHTPPYPPGGIIGYSTEVWHYTNLYVADFCLWDSNCQQLHEFDAALARATNAGKSIYLLLKKDYVNPILDIATPYWNNVKYVEVAHEEGTLTSVQLEERINSLKGNLTDRGLPLRPFGVTLGFADIFNGRGGFTADPLDFVNVTAYVTPPGNPDTAVNVAQLNADLDSALQIIPASKNIFWWMQAYNRLGEWTNVNLLKDLQAPVYLKSYNQPRVIGIIMFAYARGPETPEGTRYIPELKIEHRRIAEKLYFQTPLCLLACDGEVDGDHRGDLTVFRPSDGYWHHLRSSSGFTQWTSIQWGWPGDVPIDGDFDGDGKMDVAVFRSATGEWHIRKPDGSPRIIVWGVSGDVPVAGDFDGDGKTDVAVFRPANGYWYIQYTTNPDNLDSLYQWGLNSDVPIAADFDGDGRSEICVYRPSSGEWYIRYSTKNYGQYQGNWYFQWGIPSENDEPVAGDFDGDGKADITVFRPGSGVWFIRLSTSGYSSYVTYQWGTTGDRPVSMDIDGDGRSELTAFRPDTGQWFILYSSSNYTVNAVIPWGIPGDVPLPFPTR